MCTEYHIQVNMYHVSAQGVDECMINVYYYYYYFAMLCMKMFIHFLYVCLYTIHLYMGIYALHAFL